MPEESQKTVEVMSAITMVTPGAKAEHNCWPTAAPLAMSISAGSIAITGLGGCSGSATGSSFGRAAVQPRSRLPGAQVRAYRALLRTYRLPQWHAIALPPSEILNVRPRSQRYGRRRQHRPRV